MKTRCLNPRSLFSLVLGTILVLSLGLFVALPNLSQHPDACHAKPEIDLEKHTNGQDADIAPGPQVLIGQTVTWEYIVTNRGNVILKDIVVTDDILGTIGTVDSLAPGATATLTATGTATAGQYVNIAKVIGKYCCMCFCDTDLSHYYGIDLCLDIEKHTNGVDADTPTGPEIFVGDTVTWEYIVTNYSDVTLSNVVVTDDILGEIDTIDSLAPSESVTLTATGIAQSGQHSNIGTVQAKYLEQTITDSDPSHYFGVGSTELSLDIEKHTNGVDADTPTGTTVLVDDTVTWEYIVTNYSNVTLSDIVVTDDILGEIGNIDSLAPGESITLTANGTAIAGQYENLGTATAEYLDQTITDSDPSHYFGVASTELALDIEKHTNGVDADTITGPIVLVGDTVTWDYFITNTSPVTLSDILVTDDILGEIGGIDSLAPGESTTLTTTGIAQVGQHSNTGTAQVEYLGQIVTDSDSSHYFGVDNQGPANGDDGDDGLDDDGQDDQTDEGDGEDEGKNTDSEGESDNEDSDVLPGESKDDSEDFPLWAWIGIGIAVALIGLVAIGLATRRA